MARGVTFESGAADPVQFRVFGVNLATPTHSISRRARFSPPRPPPKPVAVAQCGHRLDWRAGDILPPARDRVKVADSGHWKNKARA